MRAIIRHGFISLLAISLSSAAPQTESKQTNAPAVDRPGISNPDFERGDLGRTPPGWFVPQSLANQGFTAVLSTNSPRQGAQCVTIQWPPLARTPAPNSFANLMQGIDATTWRGKRIKVTAAIRVEEKADARAQMWLRVDRPEGIGAFDNMNDRPVTSSSWADYSILAEVAEDAKTLNLGLMTFNGATAWWDDIRVEVLGEFKLLTQPPRALTDTGLTNLIAFTRLLGYVRHFHPSDQAATNDWLSFAVTALPQIEAAETPAVLAARLEAVFRPIAPTVRVFEVGQEPTMPGELKLPPDPAQYRIRAWEHAGHNGTEKPGPVQVYKSFRLTLEARELPQLPSFAQPTNIYRSNLGGGIACLVPTALFADEGGTIPWRQHVTITFDPVRYSIAHRDARLVTVMTAWNILQHFYPYFDVVDVNWTDELKSALRKAAADPDEAAFYQTLNRLIVALQDGHGHLSGPGMPQNRPLPVTVEWIENKVVVVGVPAGITNVHPGDVLESVDGSPAVRTFETLGRNESAATPGFRNYRAAHTGWSRRANPELQIQGADGVLHKVTIAQSTAPALNRPPKLHEIKPGIFYVDITRLSDEEFQKALPQLTKSKGLVFDLRGYPIGSPNWLTHLSRQPLQSAQWKVPNQHRPDWTDVEWTGDRWNLPSSEPQLTTNRVFITDASAVSYAESLMGIVEAYRLGKIVGEPTAGTNGNISPTDLPLGYRMIFTGMKVLKHDGSQHHGVGIQPTVPVTKTIQGLREGRDEQLEQALKLVETL